MEEDFNENEDLDYNNGNIEKKIKDIKIILIIFIIPMKII